MPFKYIAYWLNNDFTVDRKPIIRRLKSTVSSNTVFPPVGTVPWTDLSTSLQSAFQAGTTFSLVDVQTNPSNNEHVILIGNVSLNNGGIAMSKDAGDTWVNPIMPSLANYNAAAQTASSGIWPSPFDMTSCGYNVTVSNNPKSVYWYDDNNIYVTAGPYVLKCTNWTAYVTANTTPVFQVVAAVHDNRTPDTQFIGAGAVACGSGPTGVRPAPLNLTSIYFESATVGVCTTEVGIFSTSNGGTTWQKISDDSLFQKPNPAIFSTILPWKIGAWGVERLLGVHKNGNEIVAVAQNYLLKGTFNTSTLLWTFQPILCADAGNPAATNPPCSSVTNNRWRSLNWFKNSASSYTYYVTGTNSKIYTSSNGSNWQVWVPPDTQYSTNIYPDYQDMSFYTSSQCFLAFGEPSAPGNPTANLQKIYNESFSTSDTYTAQVGVTPVQSLDNRYMAVWVGVNPESGGGGGGGGTQQAYVLTNCDQNAVPLVIYTGANLSAYVNKVISNFIINEQITVGCWTVSGPVQTAQPLSEVIVDPLTVSIYTSTYLGPSACLLCATSCFKLIACDDPSDFEFVYSEDPDVAGQMSPAIYQTIQTPLICNSKCYYVIPCSGIPTKPPINLDDLVTGPDRSLFLTTYVSCAQCKGVPPVTDLKPRAIKPGFYTPGCPPEYTVRTSCTYGEQVYDEMVSIRYGIDICCDHDVDKWDIKKELLELKAIYDDCACANTTKPCPVCVEPCNVTADVTGYVANNFIQPPPPCISPGANTIKVQLVKDP